MLCGGKTPEGYRIIFPSEMITYGYDVLIKLCVRKNAGIIEKELRAQGFRNIESVKIKLDANAALKVRNLLADGLSRNVFDVCLDFVENGGNFGFADIYTPERYFPPDILRLDENEVFVDGGGYDGTDTREFVKLRGGSYKHIYLFEPMSKMASWCGQIFAGEKRISVIQAALGNECKISCFDSDDDRSKMDALGTERVRVVKLDEMTLFPPTLIKLDIEGFELDALNGMKELIAKHKPKLAVCLYHKPQDILEIPGWVSKNFPFYRFYMRKHHAAEMDEMLLYCI